MSNEQFALPNDFDIMQAGAKQTEALIDNFYACLDKIDEMGDYVDITPYLNSFNSILDKLPEKKQIVSDTLNYNSSVNRENVREFIENLVYSSVNTDLIKLTSKLQDEVGPVYNTYKLMRRINELILDSKDANIEKIEEYTIKLLKELKRLRLYESETIKVSELIKESYMTVFDTLLFEKTFGFNDILVYLKEDNDNYSREALSKILRSRVSRYLKNGELEKNDLDDDYINHLEEGIGYDFLSSDFLGKISKIRFNKLYEELNNEKKYDKNSLSSKIDFYNYNKRLLERNLLEINNVISDNKKKLLSTLLSASPIVLVPGVVLSLSALLGIRKSYNTPSYQTITRTVDLNTGKQIGNDFIVYDDVKTSYVATVMIYDPWVENKLGSGYTREVYAYEYSIPSNVLEDYHISIDDIESGEDRMKLKYQYTEHKEELDLNDSMEKTGVQVIETFQNKENSKPTTKYLMFHLIRGSIISAISIAIGWVLLHNALYGLNRRLNNIKYKIHDEETKVDDLVDQMLELNDERERLIHEIELYEKKYGDIISDKLDKECVVVKRKKK